MGMHHFYKMRKEKTNENIRTEDKIGVWDKCKRSNISEGSNLKTKRNDSTFELLHESIFNSKILAETLLDYPLWNEKSDNKIIPIFKVQREAPLLFIQTRKKRNIQQLNQHLTNSFTVC